jgi:P27 family predicted phage terminase small subunit
LKKLAGNPGKRALNTEEPQPRQLSKLPAAPADLSVIGKAKWRELGNALIELRLMTNLDLDILERYCTLYDRLKRAEKMIKQMGGEVTKSEKGAPYQNPWVAIYNRTDGQLIKLGEQLGLSPSARSRLKVLWGGGDEDPEVAKFLGTKDKK